MKRLVIRDGRVIDIETRRADLADILIEDGTIRIIGSPGMAAPEDAETISAADRLLVPGLVNGHTHAHGALGKGLVGDRVPLEVFLSASVAMNGHRTVDDKYLSAALSAIEMVRRGCTAAYDLFVEFPLPSVEGVEAVAQAYHDVGMRAVVAPMMADHSLFQALPGLVESLPEKFKDDVRRMVALPYHESTKVCRAILQGWRYDRRRIRPGLAPTIPLHCSDDFWLACRDLARDYDVRLQTHLAETKTQAVLGLKKYGKSLTAHLAELDLLGERFSAAHAIWIDKDDIQRLADAGCGAIHNPMSNLRIGSGVAPVRAMLSAGLHVGIGTDATNTSDGQNMFEAVRLAAFLSRTTTPDYQRWLSVEETMQMATTGSAGILGFSDIGRLAAGYKADIVFLDLGHITYVPLRDPLLQLAFSESGAAVDSVMIDGRFVLRAGRFLTVDETKLRRKVEAATKRLDAANAADLAFAHGIADLVGAFCIGQAHPPHQVHRLEES
jgi:cytosine/adenosine deaminase-related metal-dependent hydrolase